MRAKSATAPPATAGPAAGVPSAVGVTASATWDHALSYALRIALRAGKRPSQVSWRPRFPITPDHNRRSTKRRARSTAGGVIRPVDVEGRHGRNSDRPISADDTDGGGAISLHCVVFREILLARAEKRQEMPVGV